MAHRGGAGEWPENTMPAFQAAVDLGYRYVETDVHATSDGVLVAFHDESLDRVGGRSGLIREHTWAQLADVRVHGREPIVRFDDLLSTFPQIRVNVDAKHGTSVDPLVQVLRDHDALDRVCIASFSDQRLRRVRDALGPEVLTAAGPREVMRVIAAGYRVPARVGRLATGCVQVPIHYGRFRVVDERFVAVAHAHGLQVHVWTVDEHDTMHDLLDLGVDGIMTDRPALLRQVLRDRGHWH
ncbi:MAG: glycerophosphodiester phosphodiesterase [Actinomycetia bacterium]|nr:glycerophosphodiester phosphodiesterase [Actinomycetes bacterium]MCP4085502.1 glycerophosphodiester phosphodiesterase [Actinomycetes bacterium]